MCWGWEGGAFNAFGEGVATVGVGGRGCNCDARATKRNIKKLLSERVGKVLADAPWRRPYVSCVSGGNYQSSSGGTCQKAITTPASGHTLGLPSPWRQAHIMTRARARACVFTKTLKIHTGILVARADRVKPDVSFSSLQSFSLYFHDSTALK